MDKASNRRRPTGWFLTHIGVASEQYYPIASLRAADTKIIQKTALKSSSLLPLSAWFTAWKSC